MKSKTSSYIKQTLGQIRNPVPSLLSMIANHLILSKDTHIQNYFPDKMYYFPDYFPKQNYFPKLFPRQKLFPRLFPKPFQTGFQALKNTNSQNFFQKARLDFFSILNTKSVPSLSNFAIFQTKFYFFRNLVRNPFHFSIFPP